MPIHDWTPIAAGMFHHFHNGWIYRLADALNRGLLPKGYFAAGEQITGQIEPDVVTLGSDLPEDLNPADLPGAVAVAEHRPQTSQYAAAEAGVWERKQDRLAIRHVSGDRVVAVIEIISPGNKSSRYRFESFVNKTVALLESGVHLVLIDLFPPGRRDPEGLHAAIWEGLTGDTDTALQPGQRLFASYSAGETIEAFIEPRTVGAALPETPLFLTPGWYIPLPLEQTYHEVWEGYPEPWKRLVIG